MFCGKCGKEAFPVGVACLGCGSTLEAVPKALNPEVEEVVFCPKCGLEANDVKLFCLQCLEPLPRPFTFESSHDDLSLLKDFVFEISCSDEPCEECKKFDGKAISREELKHLRMPIQTCKRAVCWCTIIGVGNG